VLYSNKTFTSYISRTVPITTLQINYLILLILLTYLNICSSTTEYRYAF
jgi:hypothetical protein